MPGDPIVVTDPDEVTDLQYGGYGLTSASTSWRRRWPSRAASPRPPAPRWRVRHRDGARDDRDDAAARALQPRSASRWAPTAAVSLDVGTAEFGNGTTTVHAQLVAELLGIAADRVGSGSPTPTSPRYDTGAFGSAGIVVAGKALHRRGARDCATGCSRPPGAGAVLEAGGVRTVAGLRAARRLRAPRDHGLRGRHPAGGSRSTCTGSGSRSTPAPARCGSCESVQGVDAGTVLNPEQLRGQVEGGTAQAIGSALYEEVRVVDGHVTTGSFRNYHMPQMADVPRHRGAVRADLRRPRPVRRQVDERGAVQPGRPRAGERRSATPSACARTSCRCPATGSGACCSPDPRRAGRGAVRLGRPAEWSGHDRRPPPLRRAPQPRAAPTYLVGAALMMMADNIEHVITYWVLWQQFHSPALAGFAVISHWLPFLLLSVPFGQLADRYDCRRIIQVGALLFALGVHRVGRAVRDGHADGRGGLRAARAARHRRSAVGPGRAADAARLRRPGGAAERRAPERHVPQPRHPGRPGRRRRCCCSGSGPEHGHLRQRALLPAADPVPVRHAVHRPHPRRGRAAAARGVPGGVPHPPARSAPTARCCRCSCWPGSARSSSAPRCRRRCPRSRTGSARGDASGLAYGALLFATGAGGVVGGVLLEATNRDPADGRLGRRRARSPTAARSSVFALTGWYWLALIAAVHRRHGEPGVDVDLADGRAAARAARRSAAGSSASTGWPRTGCGMGSGVTVGLFGQLVGVAPGPGLELGRAARRHR